MGRPAGSVRRALDVRASVAGTRRVPESGKTFFHGRDREIDRLVRLVRDEPLVLLHGESGLGKTSLLQAGLFRAYARSTSCPCWCAWTSPRRPARWPSRCAIDLGRSWTQRRWRDRARSRASDSGGPAHRSDGWLWSPRQTPLLPVVVLDQFEELFTLGGGLTAPEVRDFVDELAEVVLDRVPRRDVERLDAFDRARPGLKVVLSFREEFLAHVEGCSRSSGRRCRLACGSPPSTRRWRSDPCSAPAARSWVPRWPRDRARRIRRTRHG